MLLGAQLSEIQIANNKYAKDKKTLLDQQLKPLEDIIAANKTKLEDDKAYQRLVAEGIKVNSAATLSAAQQGYANATELADYLVNKDIPFREAHHIVGEVVLAAIAGNKALEDFTLAELQVFSQKIEQDVYQHLTIESCLDKRQVLGGTSREQVEKAIQSMQEAAMPASPVTCSPAKEQIRIALRQV